MRQREQGFTLIELLVVIAVIGILAVFVTFRLSTAQRKSQNARASGDITQIGKAIETWKSKRGGEAVLLCDITGNNGQYTPGCSINWNHFVSTYSRQGLLGNVFSAR